MDLTPRNPLPYGRGSVAVLVLLAIPAILGAQTNGQQAAMQTRYIGYLEADISLVQANGQQTPAQTSNPGSVQGRVTDGTTGSGIGGANLHLFPRSSGNGSSNQAVSTTSLEDGSFRFEQVNAGSYVLFCTDADYVLASNQSQTVTVGAGQQVTDLAIQLNPMGELHGKVVDENGKGVPGMTVELFSTYNERGAMQLRRGQSTTSGVGGVYRLGKVRPGKYYLAAGEDDSVLRRRAMAALNERLKKPPPAAPPPIRTAEGVELNFVRTFYPKATTFDDASVLEVPPGGSVPDANIQLQRAETFHVSGKVESVGAAGLRRGAMLSLAARNTPALGGTGKTDTVRQNGTFFMDKVPSGSYTLWLLGSYVNGGGQGRRGARMRILARQDVDVNASDVENIQLSLLPPVNLSGQVTMANAPSTTSATQMRVNLTPLQQTGLGGYVSIPVNPDGTFALQDVDPGEYMVRLTNPPAGMYVKSLTWNQQDVTASGIDLTQGGGGEIQISLHGGAGEVDGTVTAGGSSKSVSGMAVLVPETIPADGSGSLLGTIKADGTFAIASVPPGHYSAYAVEHWTSIWQNLEFLRMMQRNGTSVEVEENGHGQLQLSLITVDELQADAGAVGLSLQ